MRCTSITKRGDRCQLSGTSMYEKCHVHSDDCPICLCKLSSDDVCRLRCGHCFHSSCLYTWNYRDYRCPSCRSAVLTPRRVKVYHYGTYDIDAVNEYMIHNYITTEMLDIHRTSKLALRWIDSTVEIYDDNSGVLVDTRPSSYFTNS